ncbi:unnamed protein product [Brugia pahangi]|uniref:AraC family transcriptional regulator n=1 Tax=Brugia pahangi TaxID=6280 RepID=A0A0N4TV28_BRUPA|nr:unnamed protein product [Brugia pahangi]
MHTGASRFTWLSRQFEVHRVDELTICIVVGSKSYQMAGLEVGKTCFVMGQRETISSTPFI